MASLRKHQISGPVAGSVRKESIALGGGAPKASKQDQDRVAELLKRRQSTRIISAPIPVGKTMLDAPGVPVIPSQFSGTGASGSSRTEAPSTRRPGTSGGRKIQLPEGKGVPVNVEDYMVDDFDASSYISTILRDATEDEVRQYQADLIRTRKRTSADLQTNVYVNRIQFISISKEIGNVKEEMRTLRNLLAELDLTTQSLNSNADSELMSPLSFEAGGMESMLGGGGSAASRKKRNRTSIADLTQMWATHLKLLWERVENSQKYLPASPGRHIVMDSPQWVELNSATWKPTRQVHMFLLNDHLLVASLKKRRPDAANRGGPPTKLFAEHCWQLNEVDMIDLATSSSETCAINIRVAKESFVYRSDKADKKAKLLMTFKKTVDEMRKALKSESDDQKKVKDNVTFLSTRDPALQDQDDLLRTISASMGRDRPNIMIDVDGTQRNLRWVETQMDELDELISRRNFEDAVGRLEFLRGIAMKHAKSNTVASEFITFRVDERALRLSAQITADLREYASWKTYVKKNADWLVRLEFEDRAREALLDARSATMKLRTRQVRFEGDIPSYVSQVALVQFTLIRNTVEIYNACFEYRLSSPLVKWAKEHVEGYSDLVTRQLSSVTREDDVFEQCVQYTLLHSTLLTDVGLDFRDLMLPRVTAVSTPDALGESSTPPS
ncbi:exocyst complex component exo84 [Orbilia oligospora]|uniref:Exocyst complex component EXO84 n=1 Tax=Orbilia oligospora TaxID=2813651 RepID=A0A7C8PSF6_ORBOL|nr:exocyst complex component exo84 [Orbilia oligospora]KAF3298139.1 exocyst complex component exo84 [Orbilia oligospora]TGJ67456.1 exocyst complex component exo84 [Orbilia oligospora]